MKLEDVRFKNKLKKVLSQQQDITDAKFMWIQEMQDCYHNY